MERGERAQAKGKGIYEAYVKRPADFVLAFAALVVLSPLIVTVWVLVRVKLGSPVVFRQKRPGLNEKIFTMYKFRTMTDARDKVGAGEYHKGRSFLVRPPSPAGAGYGVYD